jgi:multiple sugar transport system substrate-binding protein
MSARHPRSPSWLRSSVAVTAAAVAAALLLAGCGSGGSDGASGSSNTLTVWEYTSPTVSAEMAYLDGAESLFKKDHPGVQVNFVYVPYDQLQQKLINSALARTGPDVVMINIGDTPTLASAGTLAPLDSYWDSYPDKGTFSESALSYYDNKLYAVGGSSDILALWYNKNLMSKLHIAKPPTTIAQLNADMAKAVAAGYQGITLCGLPNDQGEYQEYPWLTAEGFSWNDPTAASLEKAYALAQGWVKSGALSKEVPTWDQTIPFEQWEQGKTLFAENGNWNVGEAKEDAKFSYGVAPLPIAPLGRAYASGTHPAIGTYATNKNLAWDFIEDGFLTPAAQIEQLPSNAGVPASSAVQKSSAISSNPILAGLASDLAKFGAPYPSPYIPPKNVASEQTLMGQTWSKVLDLQLTPEAAASQAMQQLKTLLAN